MRFDLKVIASWIGECSRVLDLGCGEGNLLEYLVREKGARATGIEADEEKVHAAIGRGLSVLQGDLLEELSDYGNQSFDYVVLSQTLMQVYDVAATVKEMLRVGRRGIVSFPNFSHWRIRAQLLTSGRAPVSRELPYAWHDTPNIRVITLADFKRFCREQEIAIVKEAALDSDYRDETGHVVRYLPAWRATYGIYMLDGQGGTRP